MKVRESGMPEEGVWAGFFDPARVLGALGVMEGEGCRDVVDVGCGYGTFAIPAARIVSGAGGVIHALDIEAEMVAATEAAARAAGLGNVRARRCDFVAAGFGLADASVDYVMMFNILHAEEPGRLLREAFRVLRVGGVMGIMHWRSDVETPRGPSMAIRPRPEQCRAWAEEAGFTTTGCGRDARPTAGGGCIVDLPPHHFGIQMRRA